ncbi:YfiM family lipoprotein [Serratia entomophila]|jgi:putative lipoprotein|uniref:YfiM family lipoprotein n=1 Tax=Serratia entomophila TaxID=42906 RepID=UPI00217B6023|nr:YfiM family lipoprotein [Serratia entomophila]CAI1041420.1 lipoprotein [Serratia entomophila]CAI1070098.1 lipoprotein [Serratia entomophila]CAI1098407.1 lipoprotein [Serratia entomophila]CAI1101379.1 lipoprotein [Serratia entomophila]CAI1102034.1 lipoprotein [Serratia entomophila]
MRPLRLSVVPPLLLLTSGCTHLANDSWTGKDKAQHFVASAAFAAAGAAYGDRQNWNEARSRSFGLAFSVGLGAAKELYDSREGGTGWSWKDFAWDVAGAAAGYSLYHATR